MLLQAIQAPGYFSVIINFGPRPFTLSVFDCLQKKTEREGLEDFVMCDDVK